MKVDIIRVDGSVRTEVVNKSKAMRWIQEQIGAPHACDVAIVLDEEFA